MSVSLYITSGKGGVGKSTLTANLGAALIARGCSVVIIDADIGLRSMDALLGLENEVVYDLIDVAKKDCSLSQALLVSHRVPGLNLLPASQFARARDLEKNRLKKIIGELKQKFDYVLIDSPAGIERGFRTVLNAGIDESLLIVTPDDICIRDAERAAQVIAHKELPRPRIIVNRLDPDLIFRKEMLPARVIADTLDLPLLGEIPEDPAVYRSVLRHTLFMQYDCSARRAVLRIAGRLQGEIVPLPEIGLERPSLWKRLLTHRNLKEVTPIDSH